MRSFTSVGQTSFYSRPRTSRPGKVRNTSFPAEVSHVTEGTVWLTEPPVHTQIGSPPSTLITTSENPCQLWSFLPVLYFPCLKWYKWKKRDNNWLLCPYAREPPAIKEPSDNWDIWIQFHTLLLSLTCLSLASSLVQMTIAALSHLTGVCEYEHIKDWSVQMSYLGSYMT